jgi:hypothetical protein
VESWIDSTARQRTCAVSIHDVSMANSAFELAQWSLAEFRGLIQRSYKAALAEYVSRDSSIASRHYAAVRCFDGNRHVIFAPARLVQTVVDKESS